MDCICINTELYRNMNLSISIILFTVLLPGDVTEPQQRQIPVLCYHNIKSSMGQHKFDYTITTAQFQSHMKMLADSGYQPPRFCQITILKGYFSL